KKIISRHDRDAVSDGSQEFLEVFTAQRPPVLLVAKHHRVVEVKNDAAIGTLQETELEFVKADCFEKNDHVMPTCFLEHAQPLRHARTSRRDDRRLDVETGIVIKTVSQTQPRAGIDTVLDCIITIGSGGHVLEFNPAAERTFGFSRDEAIGKELADLIIPPRMREQHRRGLAHYLKTGEGPVIGKRIEIAGVRKDGSE